MARTDALDTIANNLANSSTSGFRGTKNSFSSVLAGSGHELNSVLNEDTNAYGMLGDTHLDMKAGSLEATGNTLDIGIDGTAFLAVQTANGTAYTTYDQSTGIFQDPAGGTGIFAPSNTSSAENWVDLMRDPRQL